MPLEEEEPRLAVVELDGLEAAEGDVGRVDLELQEEDVALALRDVAELEGEPSVVARFADGARLDRVDRLAFRPARAELQVGVLQRLPRANVESRLVEQAAAQPRGRVDRQRRRRRYEDMGVGPLAEDVEER